MQGKSGLGKVGARLPVWLGLCLLIVAALTIKPPIAHADYLYFWDEAQARNMATRLNPTASESQIEKAFSEYQDFIKALGTQSLFAEPYGNKPFYHVKVIDHFPGLRMNPMDASQYDRFALRAMGPGGVNAGPEIIVSDVWLSMIVQEFDTPKDFEWYISDHHVAGNVSFGSEAHRQTIYQLVDPDGFGGLPAGERTTIPGNINHGRITKYLLTGFPSQTDFFTSSGMAKNSPRANRPLLTGDETVDLNRVSEALNVDNLIRAAALAEKYTTFDPRVGEMAKEALGLICTLSLANPDFATDDHIRIAERANYVGQACRQQLHLHLWTYAARYERNMGGNIFEYYDDSALPIDGKYALNPILDIMLKEDVFRSYPGVVVTSDSDGELRVIPDNGMLARNSRAVMDILADIAFDKEAAAGIPDIRPKALAVIERLVFPLERDGAEEREKYKIAQMTYHEVLWRWMGETNDNLARAEKMDWYFPLMCRNGWGDKRPALAFVEERNYTAGNPISTGGEFGPEAGQRMNDAIRHLATMRRTSTSDSPAHIAISGRIDEWIEKYREEARYWGEEDNGAKRFLAIYDGYMAANLSC